VQGVVPLLQEDLNPTLFLPPALTYSSYDHRRPRVCDSPVATATQRPCLTGCSRDGAGGETAVEKIVVPEVDIRPCRGCNACEMLNRCVQRDDMDYIHDRIIAADCIILASPIYCMGLAAQAKVLVDRAQVFRSRKYVLHLPVVPPERKGKRVGIFLSTAGQTWDYVFDAAIRQ